MSEESKYGFATVGHMTSEERKIEIKSFVQAQYKDNRMIMVSELEDESYILVVENFKSSGRNLEQKIWLSRESFVGLLNTAIIHLIMKGESLDDMVKEATEGKDIFYRRSDNLNGI